MKKKNTGTFDKKSNSNNFRMKINVVQLIEFDGFKLGIVCINFCFSNLLQNEILSSSDYLKEDTYWILLRFPF